MAITIGSVAANLSIGADKSAYSAITALIILGLLTIVIDILHIKSFRIRKLINSEPAVIIENGKINNQNIKKTRLAIEDLTMLLREKNVFNIADVEFALLENDGKLSVLPKSQNLPLTPSDLKIPTVYKGLTKDMIIDGNIMDENLKDSNLSEEWLINQLGLMGINDIEGVFYAGLDTKGDLFVSTKNTTNEKHGKYGIE